MPSKYWAILARKNNPHLVISSFFNYVLLNMKKIVFFVAFLGFTALFIGCTNETCYVCTTGAASNTHCEGDFANLSELETYIDALEGNGSTCTLQ